jgi:hypothetical protein
MGFQKIAEIFDKPEYKDIKETFKYSMGANSKPYFEYDEFNPLGTGYMQNGLSRDSYKIAPMAQDDYNTIAETVKNVPFSMLAKEFLSNTGSSGANGAYYLVPVKIHGILQTYASPADIINDVSMQVLPASELPGSTYDITIAKRSHYAPAYSSSGGVALDQDMAFCKATLNFAKTLTVNFNIGNDLIEDTPQLSLMETHIRMAGAEMGKKSTTEVLTVMASTNDGDGTLNTDTAGSDTTTLNDVSDSVDQIIVDEFKPDRLLCCSHVMKDAIMKDTTYMVSGGDTGYRDTILHGGDPQVWGLKWVRCDHASLWTEASNLPTKCISYVFTKDYSYISGRKRWLRIENYSDPIRDLVGAVISSRQDTVSVYDDSVCKTSES